MSCRVSSTRWAGCPKGRGTPGAWPGRECGSGSEHKPLLTKVLEVARAPGQERSMSCRLSLTRWAGCMAGAGCGSGSEHKPLLTKELEVTRAASERTGLPAGCCRYAVRRQSCGTSGHHGAGNARRLLRINMLTPRTRADERKCRSAHKVRCGVARRAARLRKPAPRAR